MWGDSVTCEVLCACDTGSGEGSAEIASGGRLAAGAAFEEVDNSYATPNSGTTGGAGCSTPGTLWVITVTDWDVICGAVAACSDMGSSTTGGVFAPGWTNASC